MIQTGYPICSVGTLPTELVFAQNCILLLKMFGNLKYERKGKNGLRQFVKYVTFRTYILPVIAVLAKGGKKTTTQYIKTGD
jgi:hypothetical protein